MANAAIYLHVTLEDQPTGRVMVSELDACRAYAARQGYTVIGEFNDTDSTPETRHGGLRAMIEAIGQYQAEAVIVVNADQIGSSPEDHREIYDAITATGARIESASVPAAPAAGSMPAQ
jgi:DNA invertase Pin-like site-specific DNA recombinase